ncbi:ChrR family anti-sigma-E factor [Vibrio hannami]|uniref:ChrR family anti-sigma-E factor n=1 Tax=Vibrio hannami TaxID=2717094 RepID=UPI00240F0464|nr:ChrR family anti-sigma-E factor [Vibrio hannami]MDG3084882.1 ChrR family anti-sigma-E factor [Vibrio hannami]
MIKHHPSRAVLEQFVAGELHDSVSVIVASHIEMCPDCQELVFQLTEQAALDAFELSDVCLSSDNFDFYSADFDESKAIQLANLITETQDEFLVEQPVKSTEIKFENKKIELPRAMSSIVLKEWQGLGKVSRARLQLDDDERRMSLLHIAEGGNIPSHSHNGFEITLLLQGSFEDEMGHYQAGDFIWLDGEHTHTPATKEGCVCLTVSSDAIHFTQGVSQIFNPLGKLIY